MGVNLSLDDSGYSRNYHAPGLLFPELITIYISIALTPLCREPRIVAISIELPIIYCFLGVWLDQEVSFVWFFKVMFYFSNHLYFALENLW